MSDSSSELTGPDLAAGIDAATVSPGQLVGGHAFGEPVLLAQVGGSWFAVGGKCTHYGAPLADGILVGESVRCPWHYACFSLREGAATCGPALNDLPVYDVVVDGGKVRVSRKRESSSLSFEPRRPGCSRIPDDVVLDPAPPVGPASVVILGGGPAGVGCAEMLRREGYRGPVVIIDRDNDVPYDRPNLSKDYLAGNAPEEWLPLHPAEFYAKEKIELVTGVEVLAIDTRTKTLTLSNGSTRRYGALLLATGASPIRLNIPGGERISYLRTLADCRSIIEKTKSAKRVVVLGASFIGLEVAASLRTRGLEVDVVAPESLPLARILGSELGELVKNVHMERGVRFHLGRKAQSISSNAVVLDDGTQLLADVIVAGVGVKPNVALAEKAGLAVSNGIVVDEFLRTSADSVFAAGDVALWPDAFSRKAIRVEHWVVAMRQGQLAARNILGGRERYEDIPFFWSAHYDTLAIQYTGHAEKWDRVEVNGDPSKLNCAISYLLSGERLATATINRDRENLEAEVAMEKALILKAPLIAAFANTEA